jgi:uncharacterized repeat protein (TIGR03837 family)
VTINRTWDIFCSVVDNFGDIGVCWRLARQLAAGSERTVRLWVDDLASFHRICPEVDPARASQRIDLVDVHRWSNPLPQIEPANIVIEGFGVRLPEAYLVAMAARSPRPVWINLEHLSAETWLDSHHALPSPHPKLPLTKYFFFPGFTPATGGLLVESGLEKTRNAFCDDPAAVADFRATIGFFSSRDDEWVVSLFSYENAALPALIGAWSAAANPVACLVPEGKAREQLAEIVGQSMMNGTQRRQGSLTIHAIPFLDADAYDRLLWSSDVNFVRGEDSFVRAQLAGRPMVWHAYPQEDGAHLQKVSAFLDRYVQGLNADAGRAYRRFSEGWNRAESDSGIRWTDFLMHYDALAAHAGHWAGQLAQGGSLAVKLAEFCEDRLE